MIAGPLDRRVTLRRATTTTNDLGEAIQTTWRDLATVWASALDVRDSERFAAQEVGAEITRRFQIRYSPRFRDLSPRDRVYFDEREHDIVAVKMLGRFAGIEITASARSD